MYAFLQRLFGSATGQATVYLGLFAAFLLFTGFVYVADVRPAPATSGQELALQGKQLWQQHNCSSCHQLYGLGGYLGPDLTNTISEKGAAYAGAIIQSGTGVMPDFNLSQQEADALVSFLEHADKTGKSARRHFTVDAVGQIHPHKAGTHE